jgi:hypothetical protein
MMLGQMREIEAGPAVRPDDRHAATDIGGRHVQLNGDYGSGQHLRDIH